MQITVGHRYCTVKSRYYSKIFARPSLVSYVWDKSLFKLLRLDICLKNSQAISMVHWGENQCARSIQRLWHGYNETWNLLCNKNLSWIPLGYNLSIIWACETDLSEILQNTDWMTFEPIWYVIPLKSYQFGIRNTINQDQMNKSKINWHVDIKHETSYTRRLYFGAGE